MCQPRKGKPCPILSTSDDKEPDVDLQKVHVAPIQETFELHFTLLGGEQLTGMNASGSSQLLGL